MMPSRARNSGTARLEKTEPKKVGYPVHSTVITRMSQTWLASQTGAMARWAWSRISRPCALVPASSCQNPAPKSAPASTV
jgi:hypothetical protein